MLGGLILNTWALIGWEDLIWSWLSAPGSFNCLVSASVSSLGVVVEYWAISMPSVLLGECLRFPVGVWLGVLVQGGKGVLGVS